MMFYCANTNKFSVVDTGNCAVVDVATYQLLMDAKLDGGAIVPDSSGHPVVVYREVVPPTAQEQRDAIQKQIDALESKTHMNRFVREEMILISVQQSQGLGLSEPQMYLDNIGYKKVKDLDTHIATLRSQIVS